MNTVDGIASCDVFLLAAGLGTRLRPLTNDRPKPMVDLCGKPIIAWNLELIAKSGFKRVIINLHYLGEKIREYVGDGSRWGLEVHYSHEPVLLDTGGGIKNIEDHWKAPYLLTINSDTIVGPDFDPGHLIAEHLRWTTSSAEADAPFATMLVRNDPDLEQFGFLAVDDQMRVVELTGSSLPESVAKGEGSRRVMFAGIQVLSRKILSRMPAKGAVFSITRDTLAGVLREGGMIRSCEYRGYWNDLGTPERLLSASNEMASIFPVSR